MGKELETIQMERKRKQKMHSEKVDRNWVLLEKTVERSLHC